MNWWQSTLFFAAVSLGVVVAYEIVLARRRRIEFLIWQDDLFLRTHGRYGLEVYPTRQEIIITNCTIDHAAGDSDEASGSADA